MMQSTEVRVAKTMTLTDATSPTTIAELGNMRLNEVTALLRNLQDKEIINKVERVEYTFTDNMFKAWLRH